MRRDLTVMFTDIEGFSRISEGMAPELLTSRLSRYFEALGAADRRQPGHHRQIHRRQHHGVLERAGARSRPRRRCLPRRAGAAAAGRALADKWRARGRPGFRTRFGLHTGPAVVGNVGARDRINYTLVGAVANQASRLEGLNKMYGTEILASGEVAGSTAGDFVWREIDRVVPAGTTDPLDVFEPLGTAPTNATPPSSTRWQRASRPIASGRFADASRLFAKAAAAAARGRPLSHLHRPLPRVRQHRRAGGLGRPLAVSAEVAGSREPFGAASGARGFADHREIPLPNPGHR